MANPTSSDVHANRPLSNLSIAYLQDHAAFMASSVFPTIPVDFKSNDYYEYTRDAFMRTDVEERAEGAESAGTGFTLAKQTYACKEYAVHVDIPQKVRANDDDVLDIDADSTELTAQQMLIKRDTLWVSKFFGTGLWTNDITGVAGAPTGAQVKQWDQTGATPVADVRKYRRAIQKLTGFLPNTLVLGPEVYDALINAQDIITRIQYTGLGLGDEAILAKVFGVDRIVIPQVIQNTAAEGLTRSTSFIFGKSALLAYSNPNPGIRKPSAGYTFEWTNYLEGQSGIVTSRFNIPERKVDRVETEMSFDQKLVGADLGAFLATVVS